MAKVKLMRFELVALIEEGKKLTEYLQRVGAVQIENIEHEALTKYDNSTVINTFNRQYETACKAKEILEKSCNIKKSFLESFTDFTEIDYHEYKQLCEQADKFWQVCSDICKFGSEKEEIKSEITRKQTLIDYYKPWENLDIPMSSVRTAHTLIFIGSFKSELTSEKIKMLLAKELPETEGIEAQVISFSPLQTCAVVLCHESDSADVDSALRRLGFTKPDMPAKKLPKNAISDLKKETDKLSQKAEELIVEIGQYANYYEKIRFLCDYFTIQKDKYEAIELAGTTNSTIYYEGYVPERMSEELKFEIERKFSAQMELFEPDIEKEDVPVLVENRAFAAGVESITDMYAHPSNKDVDPNSIMSIFYYALFGLMLSDGGYGILMIIFALVSKFKLKVTGSKKKFSDFVLYCGISTTVWGALFGGWFGDLIPTVCTAFLGMEKGPELAIWFNPQQDSVKMLLFSFLFGIIHLFAGLAVRFYNLCKHRDIIGAVCDVVPVYAFISGFAIIGKDFIEPVSAKTKDIGIKLLIAGAVLIVLTAGRSAKNILGKLGGGLYGLYNTTTGWLGDILSYARLLALNLVTAVIAMVVNQLAAMPKNIIAFILIFAVGHAVNIAINLIGTYVHTNRLQYVEFFSKFYEGGGRTFTPLKINSKYFKFKEETINE